MDGEPSFGAWLRRRRKALDLTQIELARQAGCSPESLRKVEADVLRPSKQLAELLAAALEVAPGERPAFVRFAREGAPLPADIPLPPIPQAAMLGRYRLLDRLGQGATAEVFKAFQPALDRYVAIKLLTTHLAQDAGFVAGFEREATAAARLRHPNIVQVHDFDIGAVAGRGTPSPYMVMEFIDGPTLKTELKALIARGERMPLEECLRVVEALAGALDYAHARGMVHHDVKPANAMFTAERQVVLTDFGLVHLQDAVSRARTGTASGTPAYLSPEQAQGRRGDARSDVYSLGIVLFELVAGRVPFVDDDPAALVLKHAGEVPPSPRALDPRVPEAVAQVTLTALAKAPEARYQTAGALAQALRAALGVPAGAVTPIRRAPAEPPPCPYRGLFAFREEDAPFFFGREAFAERLVAAVEGESEVRSPKSEVGGADPGLVAVIGPSGSGKSSVVYAGLLPTLRQAATLREAQRQGWLIADFRPGARPFHALAAALVPLLEAALSETDRLAEIHKLARALEEGTFGVPAVIARILEKHPQAGHVLLVVDQFEELYTLCPEPETQRLFVDALLEVIPTPDSGLRTSDFRLRTPGSVLLTLRADFMGQALAHRGLADALQDAALILGPMNNEELRRAIASPAAKLGVAFEHGLVERILADVGHEPGNLPLLEFALAALWEHAADGLLTHEAYEAIGRVEGALARYAEEVFAQLSAAERELARQAFVQMVRPGEGTEDTRRLATRAELGEDAWSLARRLADARLVVTDRDAAGIETVEVVHEALLRSWGRLREWMSADRRFRAWQERLRVELRQWEATGRDEGALLRGAPLAEAEGWLAERSAELSDAEREFVAAGQALRRRRADEREAQQQRELETAQKLAETEKRRAEEQARATETAQRLAETEKQRAQEQAQAAGALRRRARILVVALAAAAVLALVAFYFSFQFNDASRRNASLAEQNAAVAATAQAAAGVAQAANTAEVAQRAAAQAASTAAVAEAQSRATQQARAEAALIRADAQRLAAEANTLLLANGNADLIALLSLRSLKLQYSPQGDGALAAAAQLEYPMQVFGGSGRAAISPDNQYVLTGSFSEDRARLRDVQTGLEVRQFALPALTPVILPGAFSPDGRYALVGCWDGIVRLFDVQTGQEVRQFDLSGGSVGPYTSAFGEYSPDGKYIVTWKAPDNAIALWDVQTWQQVHAISVDPDHVYNDLSPDYKYVLTTTGGSTAKLWDFQTGQVMHTLEHPIGIVFAILSPDGRYIGTANLDNTAWLWDVQTGQVLRHFVGHEGRVQILTFSPDSRYLLTGGSDDLTARLWDVQTGAQLRVFTGHTGSVWSVAFSVDGRYVLTGGDAAFRMWDLQTRPPLPQFIGHTSGIESAAFSPDGRYIATGSWDHTARLWDAHTGESLQVFTGHTGVVNTGLAFSSDGRYLLTGSGDRTARLWDASTGQAVRIFSTAVPWEYSVNGVAFSPDGQYVLTGGGDVAQLWSLQTGQEVRRFTIPPGWVGGIYPVAFSPDGQYVLTGSDDGVRLWDSQTGQQTRLFQSSGAIYDARFAPDGRSILASGLGGNYLVLWDMQTGRELWRFNDVAPGLAVFSPDGHYVLAGLGDKTARMWDLRTGQEVRRFIGHTSGAYTVAFSPDGKYVFTGSEDMTGRLWDVDYHTTMDRLCSVLLRDFTADERAKYDIADTEPTCQKQ